MISLEQMRAARGLLNWSQQKLAEHAGLSATAMNNIDRGLAQPRVKTVEHIQQVFESHGVEFTEGHGVRLRGDVFRIESFAGPEAVSIHLRDVMETQLAKGGEALHCIADESGFLANRKEFFDFYHAYKKHGLKERVLMAEGTMERYGSAATSIYRWYAKDLFSQIGNSVYGDKYCMFLPDRIVVIENPAIAAAHRKQFEDNWKRSKPIPRAKSGYEEDLERMGRR